MARNGYWIECVPLSTGEAHVTPGLSNEKYRAVLSALPDLNVTAQTPDLAIDRLRHKLKALQRYYRIKGKILPEGDNPVNPPRNLRSVQGWISVYVQFAENCSNRSSH